MEAVRLERRSACGWRDCLACFDACAPGEFLDMPRGMGMSSWRARVAEQVDAAASKAAELHARKGSTPFLPTLLELFSHKLTLIYTNEMIEGACKKLILHRSTELTTKSCIMHPGSLKFSRNHSNTNSSY